MAKIEQDSLNDNISIYHNIVFSKSFSKTAKLNDIRIEFLMRINESLIFKDKDNNIIPENQEWLFTLEQTNYNYESNMNIEKLEYIPKSPLTLQNDKCISSPLESQSQSHKSSQLINECVEIFAASKNINNFDETANFDGKILYNMENNKSKHIKEPISEVKLRRFRGRSICVSFDGLSNNFI